MDTTTRRRSAAPRSPEQIIFDAAGEALARKLFGSEAGSARIDFRGVEFIVEKLADPARLACPLRVMARGERGEVLAIVNSMIGEA